MEPTGSVVDTAAGVAGIVALILVCASLIYPPTLFVLFGPLVRVAAARRGGRPEPVAPLLGGCVLVIAGLAAAAFGLAVVASVALYSSAGLVGGGAGAVVVVALMLVLVGAGVFACGAWLLEKRRRDSADAVTTCEDHPTGRAE